MKNFKEIIHSFLSQKENANPFLSENHDHTCINILINKSNFGNNGLLMAIFIVAMCFISFMFMSNLGAHVPVPSPFESEIVPGKKPDFKNPSYQPAHEYASSAPHLAEADKTAPRNTQINLSAFDMKTNNERLSMNSHTADVFPDLLDKPGVLAINTAARMSNPFEITQVQKNARELLAMQNPDEFNTNRTLQKARELAINHPSVASIKDNHIKQNAREPVTMQNPNEPIPNTFNINQKVAKSSEAQNINTRQADELKTLVFAVAKCEKKHVNTVHNELKRAFGYYRYRYIDTQTYQQVVQTLNERICSKPE